MEALIGLGLLVFLLVTGIPIAWAFAGALGYFAFMYDANLNTLMMQGFRSINSVVLIALPIFVITGYLMQTGGIAARLIQFMEVLVGKRKGGMGTAMVLASGVFGAIAGTSTAAVASIGKTMIPALEERGYPRGYSSALLGISSLLGILIPPSIIMILFGVVTRQSVAALFAASIAPAILLIILLSIINRVFCSRVFTEAVGSYDDSNSISRGKATTRALPALFLPFLILGGIYGGIFTPTEAAAVAAVAALIVGVFFYREMTFSKFSRSLVEASQTTGSIIMILLFSFMIGRILSMERIPQELTQYISSLLSDPIMILLLVNAFLIVAGAILDDVTVTVVIAPLFLPLMVQQGVDPIHYGAIVACSVVIGANSPPVAPILYMASSIGQVSVHKMIIPALTFIALAGIPVMLVTTFVPELALFIPRLFGLI